MTILSCRCLRVYIFYCSPAPALGCFSLEITLNNQRLIHLKLGKYNRKRLENLEIQNLEIVLPSTEEIMDIVFSLEYGNVMFI